MHRKFRFLAPVACAGALAVAAPARAQPNQAAGGINQGNLISALNNIAVQVDRVNALNDLTINDVRVVNVEDVANNNNVLNNALNRNDVDINVLCDFLNNNNVEVIKNALNDNNVAVTDVVAVSVLSGGDVVVFHQ